MKRLGELFNVNTFIVSQVNPYVCPFVSVDTGSILDTKLRKTVTKAVKSLMGNNIRYWVSQLHVMGLYPRSLKNFSDMILQNY